MSSGFLGTKHVLVPIQGATITDDEIRVPFEKDDVKDAPDIDDEELSPGTEQSLYSYYFGSSGVQGYERDWQSDGQATGVAQGSTYSRQPGAGESIAARRRSYGSASERPRAAGPLSGNGSKRSRSRRR